jgi:hypothetical protein
VGLVVKTHGKVLQVFASKGRVIASAGIFIKFVLSDVHLSERVKTRTPVSGRKQAFNEFFIQY